MSMNRRNSVIFKSLLIVFSIASMSRSAALDVPVADPVYDFLQRLESRAVINGYSGMTLPLTRDEITRWLLMARASESRLSAIERSLLTEFLADYRYEVKHNDQSPNTLLTPFANGESLGRMLCRLGTRQAGMPENHLAVYESGEQFIWFDIGARVRLDWKDIHQKYLLSDRYLLRGALGQALTFQTYVARFGKKYNPAFPEPYAEESGNFNFLQPDSIVTFDQVQTALVYHNKLFDLGFYRQPVSWGASGVHNLVLNRQSPLFTYFGFTTHFRDIRLTFLHGALLNDSTHFRDQPYQVRNRSKYIAAHRIDLPLFGKTTWLSASEMAIYGDGNVEFNYLVPTNFFWPAGHALEDRSNQLMALDISTHFISNVTFYGSLLIDELRFGELGRHWWANKHAVQAGARFAPTITTLPIDLQIEFTAVRPWTYSHKTLTTDYTHNAICLGFPYGANCQSWFAQVRVYFSRRCLLTGQYLLLKQGEDDATHFWGGNPTVSYELRDTTYNHSMKWLMGAIRTTNRFSITGRYEIVNDCYIKTGLEFFTSEFERERQANRFAFIELEVNY